MNYKSIIFDLGGVVVNYNPRAYLLNRYADEATEIFLYETFFASEEWQMLDKGTIEQEHAEALFMQRAKKSGYGFEMQALIDDWYYMLRPKKEVCSLILELRQFGYDIYYLSNISHAAIDFLRKQTTVMKLFNAGIASCEVQMLKPDREIYRKTLSQYGLSVEGTVFIDDTPKNVEVAHNFGMKSLLFTGIGKLKESLHKEGVEVFLG